MVCPATKPESKIQSLYCNVRYINRKDLKFDVHWNLTRPVYDAWLHGVLYYKFNGISYSKFPIDLWENFCDWMDHKKPAFILEWTYGRILKYTNFNHSCPFFGHYLIRVKNISVEHFVIEPLLPSGRFRLDVDFTENDRIPFGGFKLYFSVSDHRLEII